MKKISIFAAVGCQNLGDELILKNEIELLKQEFGETSQFRVASYDPKNPVFQISNTTYFEYFPIGLKNPKNFVRNLKNLCEFVRGVLWSDIVVIGGGGIIYDSELQGVGNPLRQWKFRARVARLLRKKLYFYGVGIDIKNPENRKILKRIFQNAWKVSVRDQKSQEQLERVGVQSKIIDDPVMHESQESGDILKVLSSRSFRLTDFDGIDFQGKQVGMALRSGYIGSSKNRELELAIIDELCQYIEKKGGRIIFLPHSLHPSDSLANDYSFMQHLVNYDREIYASLGEVYTAYSHKMIDIMISMRLHSIICSYVYGIPQVVLSYSQKTEEVIKKLKK